MLADISQNENEVLNGFVQGLGEEGKHISLSDIPWYAWTRTLRFWVPLIFTMWIAMIALSVVLHRQWSKHEHLPYPIAAFAKSLLPEEGEARSTIFHNKFFWWGLSAVLFMHLNNYAHIWYPSRTVQIPTWFNLSALNKLFPTFVRGAGGLLFWPYCRFYFTAIGISYLLAADVSFSVGIAPFLYHYFTGVFAKYGISLRVGRYLQASPTRFTMFGAQFGIFMLILYTGRHYFLQVTRKVFGFSRGEDVSKTIVWAGRIFLIALALFALQLVVVGLDWPLAILYSLGAVVFFAVMGRVIAETGVFFFQPNWYPCLVLAGVLGTHSLGLKSLLIMYMMSVLILTDGREVLIPFMLNSLKLADDFKLKMGRTCSFAALALAIGLAVGIPVTLYLQYDLGANMSDGWGCNWAPRFAFQETLFNKDALEAKGNLETAGSVTGLARFWEMETNWQLMAFAGAGFLLAVTFSFLRLRFTWWPLHPMIFLVWRSYAGRCLAWSFLAGWFLKIVVTRYAGAKGYQRLKPLMFGLIAGDMLGAFVPFLIGMLYYLITGETPIPYYVTPG